MGYGWIYPYCIYGFWKRDPVEEFESGKISEEEMESLEKTIPKEPLDLSKDDLERFGIERHIRSVYKNHPSEIVYGICIDINEGPDAKTLKKIQTASAMLERERHIPITIGFRSCVETDMAKLPELEDDETDSHISDSDSDSDSDVSFTNSC